MKLIFKVLLLCGFSAVVPAQNSFHLGSIVLDLNTGLELYNSTNVYSLTRNGQNSDTTISDKAANSNFSFGAEVGIGRFVGLGLRGKGSSFFRTLDAVTNARADIYATDLVLQINLHPLPLKKFDLVIGGEMGVSKLKMNVDDIAQTLVTGKGGIFSVYLNPRFYMHRLGFNFRAGLPVFNYKKLEYTTRDPSNYLLSQWKANGISLSLGVQFRIF
jgi:hypothetical protein